MEVEFHWPVVLGVGMSSALSRITKRLGWIMFDHIWSLNLIPSILYNTSSSQTGELVEEGFGRQLLFESSGLVSFIRILQEAHGRDFLWRACGAWSKVIQEDLGWYVPALPRTRLRIHEGCACFGARLLQCWNLGPRPLQFSERNWADPRSESFHSSLASRLPRPWNFPISLQAGCEAWVESVTEVAATPAGVFDGWWKWCRCFDCQHPSRPLADWSNIFAACKPEGHGLLCGDCTRRRQLWSLELLGADSWEATVVAFRGPSSGWLPDAHERFASGHWRQCSAIL